MPLRKRIKRGKKTTKKSGNSLAPSDFIIRNDGELTESALLMQSVKLQIKQLEKIHAQRKNAIQSYLVDTRLDLDDQGNPVNEPKVLDLGFRAPNGTLMKIVRTRVDPSPTLAADALETLKEEGLLHLIKTVDVVDEDALTMAVENDELDDDLLELLFVEGNSSYRLEVKEHKPEEPQYAKKSHNRR